MQPVHGTPVFITKSTLRNKLDCAASDNIWKKCVSYDELTINERQKSDKDYSTLLQSVRCGQVTDAIIATLQTRVINCPVTEKYNALVSTGVTPVCLFPTRKQCNQVNEEMLALLDSKKTCHPLH